MLGGLSFKIISIHVDKVMIRSRTLLIIGMLLIYPCVKADENKAERAMNIVRSLCLAGDEYVMVTGAGGSVSVKNLEGKGSVMFGKRNLQGVVDVRDEEKREELDSIRTCIQPYISRILDAELGPSEEAKKK